MDNQCLLLNNRKMKEAKGIIEQLSRALLLIIYRYMDYWLPTLLLFTLPLWLLPTATIYLFYKAHRLIKLTLQRGHQLAKSDSPPTLHYAVLKGNGKYLRQEEDAFVKQFYDYTSRHFLGLGELDPESKILEMECDSTIGLKYLMQNCNQGLVIGVQSNHETLRYMDTTQGFVQQTNYDLQGEPMDYDCILLFNFKTKGTPERRADLLKMLSYARYHISGEGSLIIGDCFENGETQTFTSLFRGFGFKVTDHEDISKNMAYATKLNQQKVAVEEGKLVHYLVENTKRYMERASSWLFQKKKNNNNGGKFQVFILQRG